jgi:hypothetical protein
LNEWQYFFRKILKLLTTNKTLFKILYDLLSFVFAQLNLNLIFYDVLMRPLFLIVICFSLIINFLSCKNTHTYDKYIKELDSLKVVMQQAVHNFKTVDSSTCINIYAKQQTYAQFINSHLKDTVTKKIAENLQNFNSIEKGITDYVSLRSSWLSEAQLSIKQLNTLSYDLKNGSIDTDEAIEFINTEKKDAEKIIEELKINTEIIRTHIALFNQSLPVCEELVKQLNNGILPELIKPKNN